MTHVKTYKCYIGFSVITCHIILIFVLLYIQYKKKIFSYSMDNINNFTTMSLKLRYVLNDSEIECKLQYNDIEHKIK